MKVAVFGDVHANRTALEAVIDHVGRWQPDVVVSVGDVVNRGPSPADSLQLLQDRSVRNGWLRLRGNHEEYIIHQAQPDAEREGPLFECFYQAFWTYQQLGRDVSTIESWEDIAEVFGPDGSLVRVAHGSVLGNSKGIFPGSSDEDLLKKGGSPAPAVFVGGHTHLAFARKVNDTLFVNAGSVGIPFDGDWRAGYAQLTFSDGSWREEIVRLSYDRENTLKEYRQSGFLTEAGPIAWLVLGEFLYAKSQLYVWHRDYLAQVTAGERTIEECVREQLQKQGMWERVRAYL